MYIFADSNENDECYILSLLRVYTTFIGNLCDNRDSILYNRKINRE